MSPSAAHFIYAKGFAHSLLSVIHKANFHLLLTSLSVVDMSDIEASIERPAV